mmetsp:Transcript_38152/g.114071  ORF Transcript_38152/g.114071 Transcript_38152/m.114071 type:complete len:110 (+) Transcript_38152:1723-2052(+)
MKRPRVGDPIEEDDQKLGSKQLPIGVTFNIMCRSCGRKRSEHGGRGGEAFGKKCQMQTCAKCGAYENVHFFFGISMGYFCRLASIPGGAVYCMPGQRETYEAKVKSWKK